MLFRSKGSDGSDRDTSDPGRNHYLLTYHFDPRQDAVVKRVAESALFFALIGLMGYVLASLS